MLCYIYALQYGGIGTLHMAGVVPPNGTVYTHTNALHITHYIYIYIVSFAITVI
jgi:hypothetical protein